MKSNMTLVKMLALFVLCIIGGSIAHRQNQLPGNQWRSSYDDSIPTISAARSANGWSNSGTQNNDLGARYGAHNVALDPNNANPRYGAHNGANRGDCPCSASDRDWKTFGTQSSGYQASW